MSKIIDPTKKSDTIHDWINAFTCVQECAADAADNSEIKRSVDENLKLLRARVKEKADPQAPAILAQQELIKRQMFMHRPEIHRQLMDLWRGTAKEIVSYAWNLLEDVHYREEFKGGKLLFWQGDPADMSPNGKIRVERTSAVLIIRFLKFVASCSDKSTPIEYTKRMLREQGIDETNFHLYADSLAFPNPWTSQ